MEQTLAITADNLVCELIYRLYSNVLNDKYKVDCPTYDTDEIASIYRMYESDCEFNETMECIKPIIPNRNWSCTELNIITCPLFLSTDFDEVCNDLDLQIRL